MEGKWTRKLSAIAFLFCLGYLVWYVIVPSTQRQTHGFVGYYAASRLVVEGKWGPQVYDNDWYIQYVKSLTNGNIGEIIKPNLPTVSLMFLPFSNFPLQEARVIWLWLNLLLLLLGLNFLARAFRHDNLNLSASHPLWLVLSAFTMVFPPMNRNFDLGQAYILVFFLFTIFLWSITTSKDHFAGISLALAFIFKSAGVFLWLIPLFQRRWKTLGWGVGTMVGFVAATLAWIGLDSWVAYFEALVAINNDPALTATAYQSVIGIFSHLFQYQKAWSPAPLIDAPVLAPIFAYSIFLVMFGITLYHVWGKASKTLLIGAVLVAFNTVLVPLSTEHQYGVMMISVFAITSEIFPRIQHQNNPKVGLLNQRHNLLIFLVGIFFIGLILLTIPAYYQHPALMRGWVSLLAYPRLYGGIILWGLSLHMLRTL